MPKKSDEPRPATQTVGFQLRFREEMRAKIEDAARESGSSMNSEIEKRLRRSFDQDEAYGPSHVRGALHFVAQLILQVETRRGAKWHEDRVAALAIARTVGDFFEYTTPMIGWDAMQAVLSEHQALNKKIDDRIGYLSDIGAILPIEQGRHPYRLNALAGLLGSAGSVPFQPPSDGAQLTPPDEYSEADRVLRWKGWRVAVDLRASCRDWRLERDGTSLSPDECVGVDAVLISLGDLAPELEALAAKLEEATAGEKQAAAEADRLVESLRGK